MSTGANPRSSRAASSEVETRVEGPKSLLRDIQLNRPKRDRALDMAADQVCAQFKGHEVHARDPVKPH
jgi:hypothetical protein